MAQRIKHPPAMQETQVRSLGWEDPLEKEMATHSSILAWRIPWTEEPGYSPRGCKESDTTERLHFEDVEVGSALHPPTHVPTSFLLCCSPAPGIGLVPGDVQLVIPEEVIPLGVFSITVPQGSTTLCFVLW